MDIIKQSASNQFRVAPKYMLPEALDVPKFQNASCVGSPTDWWFPMQGQTRRQQHGTLKAMKICHDCPEKRKCLNFALDNPQVQGIWGGTSPRKRQAIRSRLNRFNNKGKRSKESEVQYSILLEQRELVHGPLSI